MAQTDTRARLVRRKDREQFSEKYPRRCFDCHCAACDILLGEVGSLFARGAVQGSARISYRYERKEPGFYAPRKRVPRRRFSIDRGGVGIRVEGAPREGVPTAANIFLNTTFSTPLPVRIKCATCGTINEVRPTLFAQGGVWCA